MSGDADDIAPADSAPLPGAHRGGFQREFTEPVPIAETVRTEPELNAAPDASDVPTALDMRWAPASGPLLRSAGWALFFGVAGIVVSLLVGWGFLIGLLGAGLAIAALRRPWESRPIAVWALCLSVVSLVYSAGWLWWASTQGPLFG
ncbi:MAG: hypothetical protein J0I43_10670 [Microbacterium sp.]|uniref:hypothetical protein n=1 Tax=Microbacterium sp. TaxID=51671 RepID=UPI001ACD7317|nr:hypothetical protein [Microbacterium sp.]MBN9177818.1 hypothetical protein [Microbacterium sp.]